MLRAARSRDQEEGSLVDFDRPLTRRGETAAIRMGKLMQKKGYLPDLVICSTTARARQTLSNIWPSLLRKPHLIHDGRMHQMDGKALMARLQQADASHLRVLVVGNAAGNTELARLLCPAPPAREADPFAAGIAPCTLVIFDCDLESWSELEPACCKLIAIESQITF